MADYALDGSAVLAGGAYATGDITFGDNPTNNDTITLNGVVMTFKTVAATAQEVTIGGSLTATITALVAKLVALVHDLHVGYTFANTGGTKLTVTANNLGAAYNAFTLAASSDTPSDATLEGGVDGGDVPVNSYGSHLLTTAAGAGKFKLPNGTEGQETALYLKTKDTDNAVIAGVFTGGTTLTFDTAGEWAKLQWLNAAWRVIVNTGAIT